MTKKPEAGGVVILGKLIPHQMVNIVLVIKFGLNNTKHDYFSVRSLQLDQ
jgi:hypothetical protein